MYIFIIILLLLAFLVWSAADISSGIYVKTFCGIKNCDEKVVSLTFDDGPESGTTEKVLEGMMPRQLFSVLERKLSQIVRFLNKL